MSNYKFAAEYQKIQEALGRWDKWSTKIHIITF
jgi:hypothetical protein